MKVKIKKLHPNAIIPKYAKEGDAGLDLTAIEVKEEKGCKVYNIGLAIEIPFGYVGLIFPRSSISNYTLTLANCVGVVDAGYRGPLMCKFKNFEEGTLVNLGVSYQVGDKVAQLIILPYPQIELEETEELSETVRGPGGFGSTGN